MRTRPCDERGDTLIEVLVAIVVIGITIVAVLGALVSGVGASAQHRNLAVDDTLLKSYADTAKLQIEPPDNPAVQPLFQPCAQPDDYQGSVSFTVPTSDSGYTVGITSVQYWDSPTGTFSGACPADLQLLGITATAPGGATQQLSIIVRNPRSRYDSAG